MSTPAETLQITLYNSNSTLEGSVDEREPQILSFPFSSADSFAPSVVFLPYTISYCSCNTSYSLKKLFIFCSLIYVTATLQSLREREHTVLFTCTQCIYMQIGDLMHLALTEQVWSPACLFFMTAQRPNTMEQWLLHLIGHAEQNTMVSPALITHFTSLLHYIGHIDIKFSLQILQRFCNRCRGSR